MERLNLGDETLKTSLETVEKRFCIQEPNNTN